MINVYKRMPKKTKKAKIYTTSTWNGERGQGGKTSLEGGGRQEEGQRGTVTNHSRGDTHPLSAILSSVFKSSSWKD